MGEGEGAGRYQVQVEVIGRDPHPGGARGAGEEAGQPRGLVGDLYQTFIVL